MAELWPFKVFGRSPGAGLGELIFAIFATRRLPTRSESVAYAYNRYQKHCQVVFQPLGGLERPPGSKNVSFGDSQDAHYGHQRISGRRDFADFEAYRGDWWVFVGLIVESWRAVGAGNQGLLVESAFWDFQVQKCDSEKSVFCSAGERFWWFLVDFSSCSWL